MAGDPNKAAAAAATAAKCCEHPNASPAIPKTPVHGRNLEDQNIPFLTKIIFAAPTVATLPFIAMWGAHGNKNYQAFGCPLSTIALFTALARSFDVISDPVMSYVTDSFDYKWPSQFQWLAGRRKPFMFFGCFFYSMFLWLLLNPPYASTTQLGLWFGCMYTAFFLCNTFTTIPYDALAPELSEDSQERTGLFFISNLFDGVGTLIAVGLPMIMTTFTELYWSDRNADICRTEAETTSLCAAGSSCRNFGISGPDSAFVLDEPLTTSLQTVSTAWDLEGVTLQQCVSWRATQDLLRDSVLQGGSVVQNDNFCDCVISCSDMCDVANKRTGFMLVGFIFGIWFTMTMVTAVFRCKERVRTEKLKVPPLVPAVRATTDNFPFLVLIPGWLCDACVTGLTAGLGPYYVEAVVAPAFQTMEDNGRDCAPSSPSYENGTWDGDASRKASDNYDSLCDTDNVFVASVLLLLMCAILGCPLWSFMVSVIGKVKTWLVWSLFMAISNFLMLFVTRGAIFFCFFAFAVNGIPLGGKFLADSILADIIDYDEFITGTRSEATYFMFKSFLPKIVQIPASAVPIALLASFGYLEPIGGRVQDQPDSVVVYLKAAIVFGCCLSVVAYFVKKRYPLTPERLAHLTPALEAHKVERCAVEDPISGNPHMPRTLEGVEQDIAWNLGHWGLGSLVSAFPNASDTSRGTKSELVGLNRAQRSHADTLVGGSETCCGVCCKRPPRFRRGKPEQKYLLLEGSEYLWSTGRTQLIVAICCLLLFLVLTVVSLRFLSDPSLQIFPVLSVVCIGLSLAATGLTSFRFRSSTVLRRLVAEAIAASPSSTEAMSDRADRDEPPVAAAPRNDGVVTVDLLFMYIEGSIRHRAKIAVLGKPPPLKSDELKDLEPEGDRGWTDSMMSVLPASCCAIFASGSCSKPPTKHVSPTPSGGALGLPPKEAWEGH